jgi:hypothetical protein
MDNGLTASRTRREDDADAKRSFLADGKVPARHAR